MNQQEIDRLWDAHCKHSLQLGQEVICYDDFAQAAAEIRRQALEEAAKRCMELSAGFAIEGMHPQHLGASDCAWSIRALAQSEQEKSC